MRFSIVLFALVLCWQCINAFVAPRAGSYCFSADTQRPQIRHFTSKTSYQVAKGTDFDRLVAVPNCKPVKFWLLSRHGTRLPEEDQILALPDLEALRDAIINNYENNVAGGLCDQDLQLIKDWVLDANITVDKAQFLTVQGWNDLKFMAQDFKKAIPELLSNYDETKFLFRHTDTQRTEASYKAFVEGLFGVNAHQYVKKVAAPQVDTLLAPFDNCPTWVDREAAQRDDGTEGGLFKKSPEMLAALDRISARLGFTKTQKYKKIKQLWDICRFETAWFLNKPSAWCTAFTMEDVLVFEYSDDLAKEQSNGYTTEMSSNIACELVQDLLSKLNSREEPSVVAYFSHSALIQLFATALGIQKDSILLKSSEFTLRSNRKFRSSEIDPLAANLAVVKYDCSADPVDPSPKIGFFSNQHNIDFEGCRNGLCKLSDFVQTYQNYQRASCSNIFCTTQKL